VRLRRERRSTRGRAMAERLRWKLWGLVTRLPRVCPASAHEAIVSGAPGHRRSPFAGRSCRSGLADRGSCYCGKLRQPGRVP